MAWIDTPSQPRATRPFSLSSAITFFAVFDGMANPMPTLPPLGEKIAVLTPITRPSASNAGPPVDVVKQRLIKYFGYNETSATDVLNYVASIFARGDTKQEE